MRRLVLDNEVDLLINITGSDSTHSVTYQIFDVDDNTLASGSCSFVRGETWTIADFTPENLDAYAEVALRVRDVTLSTYTNEICQIIVRDSEEELTSSVGIITICNLSLSHLGMKPITSLTQDTPDARECNRFYAQCRNDVLRELRWPFATTKQVLAELSDEVIGWDYVYSYPSQAITVWNIFNEGTISDKENQEFEVIYLPSSNKKVICSNLEDAYGEYTYKVVDTTLYDAKFVMALSYYLAATMAHTLTGKTELSSDLKNVYLGYISEAKRISGTEKIKKPFQQSNAIDAR